MFCVCDKCDKSALIRQLFSFANYSREHDVVLLSKEHLKRTYLARFHTHTHTHTLVDVGHWLTSVDIIARTTGFVLVLVLAVVVLAVVVVLRAYEYSARY